MALLAQKIDIPLAVGIDTKVDAKLLESGKLAVAENVVLTTLGRASKRNGYAERPRNIFGGSSIAAGDALDTFKDELLLFNGPAFYSWADGVQQWQSKGFIVPVIVGGRSAARSVDRARTVPSSASLNGQTVFAYEDSTGGARVSVMDDATGNLLQSDILLNASAANPKVVAFVTPQVFAIVYRVTNDLRVQFYTPAAGTFSAEQTITSDANATAQIDAIPAQGKCVLAYRTTGPILKLAMLLETGAFAGGGSGFPTAITINEDPTDAIAVVNDSTTGDFWLAWHNSQGVRGALRLSDFTNGMPSFTFAPTDVNTGADTISKAGNALLANALVWLSNSGGGLPAPFAASTNYYVITGDPTFQLSAAAGPGAAVNITTQGTGTHTLTVLATTIEALASIRNLTGARISATQIRWFYEQSAGATYNYLVKSNTFTSTGVPGTAAVLKRGVGLASKAWIYGGVQYFAVAFDSTLQATYFVLDSSGNIIAKLLPLVGGGVTAKSSSLADVRVDSTGAIFRFGALARQRLVSENDDQYFFKGVWDAELRFVDPVLHLGAELGGNLHIVGGALWAYDGARAVEHGFHVFPENMSNVQSGGGSLTVLGVYLYAVVYEWMDAQGQLHRSAPGFLAVTMTGGNQTNTLTIPTLRLTAKSGVSIAIYRSVAAGSVLYRVSSLSSLKLNDTTADTVSFADTTADSALLASEQLYTNGDPAVLDNDGAPACSLIAVGKERVWLAGLETPHLLMFSKRHQAGLGVEFSDFLTRTLEAEGGAETAIAIMDDKVIAFKESRIYVAASGLGPDDTGGNDFLGDPVRITTDAGCIDPNSVVNTPNGLMFKSAKGYYLLDRSLEASYIGSPVEAYNAQACRGATLKADSNQVVFKIAPTDAGVTALVYDYKWDQWYTETQTGAVDAVVWAGTYHYLTSAGRVRYETPGSFTDVGAHIPIRLRTFWVKVAGILGFQRAKAFALLGNYVTPHKLIVQIAYDMKEYFEDTLELDTADWINETTFGSDALYGDSTPYGGDGDGVYLVQGNFPYQQCTSVQLEITEAAASADGGNPGESLSLNVLSLLVAVKKGLHKQRIKKDMN